MIRSLVDFALNNRFLVLAVALLLFVWGAISFHQLAGRSLSRTWPITTSRSSRSGRASPPKQIEQQVTIPLEIVMNGMPHVTHLRSFSLFGLSDLKLIFDDEAENAWNREQGSGAALAGHPAARRAPADGHGLESGRPDLFLHAAQHQSRSTT